MAPIKNITGILNSNTEKLFKSRKQTPGGLFE